MQEVAVGNVVLLHQEDGSSQFCFVAKIISPTEVELTHYPLVRSSFNADTTHIYECGKLPGQWEPANETIPEEIIRLSENFRMVAHPAFREMSSLLTVKLSSDVEEVLAIVWSIYIEKDLMSPFYEVQHRANEEFNNAEHFYNRLMGVQEGLRSTLYFLQNFLSLTEMVKRQGAAMVANVKPARFGTLAINPGVLNAEYEGFVLLSRATLDRLTYFLKYYYQIKNDNPGLNKLEPTLKQMHGNDKRTQRLLKAMERHRTYLNTQFIGSQDNPTERNKISHRVYLGFAWPNIVFNTNGLVEVAFVYGDNLEVDATEEIASRFNALKLFIIDVLNEFFSE